MHTNQELAIAINYIPANQPNSRKLTRLNNLAHEYAKEHGCNLVKIWLSRQPGAYLREMLNFCNRNRQVKYVIVDEPHKVFYFTRELYYCIFFLNQLGIKLVSASDENFNKFVSKILRKEGYEI